MEDCAQAHEEVYNQNNHVLRQLQLDEGSFSTASVDRNQDFSFGEGSPTTADGKLWHSPVFTCKSSFSSFLDENSTPCPASGGFSFRSCTYESSPTEFSSPVPSMPSFTFFSPSSAAEQENIPSRFKAKMSTLDPTTGGLLFSNYSKQNAYKFWCVSCVVLMQYLMAYQQDFCSHLLLFSVFLLLRICYYQVK